ncbi:MAG: alkaline phosphatase [Rikenellaceae bacterium]
MRRLIVALIATAMVACGSNSNNSNNSNGSNNNSRATSAKYIFYFIGDGMAAPQIRLGEAALTSEEFRTNYATQVGAESRSPELHLSSLTTTGLATSNALDRYITDSAAAGTALATGSKTDVGIIAQSPDGTPLTTMAEMAKQRGMRVGVVSSVSIDHATPACFYSHATSRNLYSSISDQLLTSGFDYFGGGSVKWSSRATNEGCDKATAYATYRARAEQQGFRYATTRAELDAAESGSPLIATLDMLANEQYSGDGSALPYTIDLTKQSSPDNRITLADFTRKGIELLTCDEGFFLMVEGGKIDWACHANDAATAAYEVVAFDDAIGEALRFAALHPDQTLIVVTGDHDCGGLALGFAGMKYESSFEQLAQSRSSYLEFTAATKALIADGGGFGSALQLASNMLGLNDLTPYERGMMREAFEKSARRREIDDSDRYNASYGGYDPFTITCTQLVNNKSGIDFASYSHTALPVMVFAQGVNEELFGGYYDNTDIAKKIMQAADLR